MGDATWDRFCDELKEAGRVLVRDVPANDERTRAEGYRHLVRMIRAGFEVTGEFGDPRHPALFPMAGPTLLSEGVTGDARYFQAFIDGSATHRLRGTRGTAPLIEIGIYTGRRGFHPTSELVGCLTEADLEVDADGRFEVRLGPHEQRGNWLRTDGECRYLFVRQYAHDWSHTTSAELRLERDGSDGPRPPLALPEIERALERTASFVREAPGFWADISDYWARYAPNQVVTQEQADASTDITVPSGHRFACGYFQLEAQQALLVEFQPVPAPYWGIHLDNYWYETLSWDDGRSQLNDQSVVPEPDGSVRIAIAGARPAGVPNWLDTQGHRQGSIVYRLSRSTAPMPRFHTELVPLASFGTD